ncbi:MAG: response regulator, partial [Candidatus Omnitrophica bacterium]|nr:response regulator [Candidatus Omnitrophota bacterium]
NAWNYFNISTADNGEEGLEKVKQEQPDLIMLDVLMPRMNGFEVLNALKNTPEYAEIPVVIFTTKTDAIQLFNSANANADFYLPKPLKPKHLIPFVKLVLN